MDKNDVMYEETHGVGTSWKRPRLGLKEIRTPEFWRAFFAELLGTFLFHFAGLATTTYWGISDERDADSFAIRNALGFGLAIMGVVEIMGPISGGHVNPAVSIAFAVSQHISLLRALFYVVAQCCGAIASSAFLDGITAEEKEGKLGGNDVNPNVTVWGAFGTEIFYTFFLMTVIYAVTNQRRPQHVLPALTIGLTVTTMLLSGVFYGSACMNPARALGPAIFAHVKHWNNHWIFWAGPILGAVLSALVYKFILDPYRRCNTNTPI